MTTHFSGVSPKRYGGSAQFDDCDLPVILVRAFMRISPMTLIAACAASDAMVVAADSLVGYWQSRETSQRKEYREKIFPIGKSLVAYAGHADWCEEIIKRAKAECSEMEETAVVAAKLSAIAGPHFSGSLATARQQEVDAGIDSGLIDNLHIDFLCCGWVSQSGTRLPRSYHLTSKDGKDFALTFPTDLKFCGYDTSEELMVRCSRDSAMSSGAIRRLLTYSIWKTADQHPEYVNGPVRVWHTEDGKKPFEYPHDNSDTKPIFESIKSALVDFRAKVAGIAL